MRSAIVAARNRPAAADPCVCPRLFVTSEGIGTSAGIGGTVPSEDEGGRMAGPGYGMGGTLPLGDAGGLTGVVTGSGGGVTGSGMVSELLW